MEASTMDAVSALSHKLISVMVFNFFPESTKNSTHAYVDFDSVIATNKKKIMTGSVMEHLNLPIVINKTTGEIHQSDIDLMAVYTDINIGLPYGNHAKQYINIIENGTLSVIQEELYPLHCYLQISKENKDILGQNLDDLIINGFLSAKRIVGFYKEERILPEYLGHSAETNNDVNLEVRGPLDINDKVDHVPCLEIKCPEAILQGLKIRSEAAKHSCLFELYKVVTDLHDENIHVVNKPHVHSCNPDIQWRFSFSLVEKKLASSLNDIQRTTYRVLKGLVLPINEKIYTAEDKLPSYLLKTTLFWVCEELPEGFCIPQNTGKLFLALLDKLIGFLYKKSLPHFFIPEANIVAKYSVATIDKWIKSLCSIRTEPVGAMIEFWKAYKFPGHGGYSDIFVQSADISSGNIVNAIVKETLLYHLHRCNIIDFMRLYVFVNPVFCSCTNNKITDFFHGCHKCLIAKFCEETETIILYVLPEARHVLPIISNMLFIRSLHTCNMNNKLHHQKAIDLFNEARMGNDIPCLIEFYTHYALYLMANKKYEEAVHLILTFFTLVLTPIMTKTDGRGDVCIHIPCFLSEMLDEVLQIRLSGKAEKRLVLMDLAYHMLVSSYLQAGVYTELILPPNASDQGDSAEVEDFCGNRPITQMMSFYSAAQQLGDQYFLCGDYFRSAEWYITPLTENEVQLRTDFVACVANLFQPQRFQDSVKSYLDV